MKSLSLRTPSDVLAGFDNFVNKIMNEFGFGEEFEIGFSGYPRINAVNLGDKLLIEASVPGLTKENIRVDWQNGSITICGDSIVDKSRNNNQYIHRELHQSTFCRSFKIDERAFDVEKIDAKVENGLLSVIIPHKDVSKFETKKIEIK